MSSVPIQRLDSLDQFRGYTVAGMFLVNFLGGFAVTPELLRHHHTYLSYADTIMPQFLFAVGFAWRLTFVRRIEAGDQRAAYLRAARRIGGLLLLALVVHAGQPLFHSWSELTQLGFWGAIAKPLKRDWFQTLTHIAVTSLWVLPVIRASAAARVAWAAASAAVHVALSAWFNFAWVNSEPLGIDGGPLGFLTWTTPLVVGTLACDAVDPARRTARLGKMLAWAAALMLLGYGLSCLTRAYDLPPEGVPAGQSAALAEDAVVPTTARLEQRPAAGWLAEPPFVPPPDERQGNYWMMSQRSGSLSYVVFAAGWSLALYALFFLACDLLGWKLGVFRTLGVNALAAYVLHDLVGEAVGPFIPHDAPVWYVAAGTCVFFGLTYLFVWYLEQRRIYLRL
jgi:predicted acyltransferase